MEYCTLKRHDHIASLYQKSCGTISNPKLNSIRRTLMKVQTFRDVHAELTSSSTNMHHETINICTHLFGTVLFIKKFFRLFTACTTPLSRTMAARLLYLISTAMCFLCSTLCHTFSDGRASNFWRYIDHLGIQIFIWATTCSFIAIVFERESRMQLVYIVCITAGLLAFITRLWTMWYYEIGSQHSRTVIHITFGALSTLPALDSWHNMDRERDILRAFFSFVTINSIGGWIFASRFLDPLGRYLNLPDFSHAVMHIVVLYGAHMYELALKTVHD
jgi:channel protein (hemolysin III family)